MEAEARETSQAESGRPIKRQKFETSNAIPVDIEAGPHSAMPLSTFTANANRQLQTAYDSTATDDSDMEWEDVDIQQASSDAAATKFNGGVESLQITLGQQSAGKNKKTSKRRLITAAEKKLRLDIHKVHILCLLGHVQLRNVYCNDEDLHAFLKRLLPRHIIALLNPSEEKPQYTRSTTFIDGLNQASDVFIRKFKVTKPGLKRPHWTNDPISLNHGAESIISNAEVILSRDDFYRQAKTLQGSRDFGAQLFCALLRSVGVDARLVCSLQPLPFSGATKDSVSVKLESKPIVISSDDNDSSADNRTPAGSSSTSSRARRFGRPKFTTPRPARTASRPG